MQINIAGHHVEVTDSLRNYTFEKLRRLTRHSDDITSIKVILAVERTRQKAEASLHLAGADLHAAAESTDLYMAIDQLVDRLDRQLLKYKDKVTSHKKHRIQGNQGNQL